MRCSLPNERGKIRQIVQGAVLLGVVFVVVVNLVVDLTYALLNPKIRVH